MEYKRIVDEKTLKWQEQIWIECFSDIPPRILSEILPRGFEIFLLYEALRKQQLLRSQVLYSLWLWRAKAKISKLVQRMRNKHGFAFKLAIRYGNTSSKLKLCACPREITWAEFLSEP